MKKLFLLFILMFSLISFSSCSTEEIHCDDCGKKVNLTFDYCDKFKYITSEFNKYTLNLIDSGVPIIMDSKEEVLMHDPTGRILKTFVTKNYDSYFNKYSLVCLYLYDFEIWKIRNMEFEGNILTIDYLARINKYPTLCDYICVIQIPNSKLKSIDTINFEKVRI